MELEKKILILNISDIKGERAILLDTDKALLTYGSSPKCTVQTEGWDIPLCAKLLVKSKENIELFVNPSIKGSIKIGKSITEFSKLIESGLLYKKNQGIYLPILRDSSGEINIGNSKIIFQFEKVLANDIKIPAKFPKTYPFSRLKKIGGTYPKSLTTSFFIHLIIMTLVFLAPTPPISTIFHPYYRKAKTNLSLLKINPPGEPKAEKLARVKTSEEGGTLLTMLDSRKRIKGFVRNLFFSKSQAFDVGQRREEADTSDARGGLFVKIDQMENKVRKENVPEVTQLFASIENTSKLTKDSKGVDFIESELETEAPQIEGTLNSEAISKTVSTGEGGLRFCYEEALIRKPQIKGRVVVLFKLTTIGNIETVEIESSSLNDRMLEECIIKKVRTWRFPKPEGGGVTIRYPFVFYTTSRG